MARIMLCWGLLLITTSLLAAQSPFPKAEPTLIVLQAERSGPSGTEQTSLVFDDKRVKFVTNSNFLQPDPTRAVLGYFEADYNPILKAARAEAERARAELDKFKPPVRKGPRVIEGEAQPKVYIGASRVPLGSPLYTQVLALLSGLPAKATWIAQGGGEVTYEAGTQATLRRFNGSEGRAIGGQSKVTCEAPGGEVTCKVEDLGIAWFRKAFIQPDGRKRTSR